MICLQHATRCMWCNSTDRNEWMQQCWHVDCDVTAHVPDDGQYLTPTCGSGKWTDDLDSSAGRAVQDALGPGKNDVNARTPPYIMPNSESQPAWPMGLCKPVSNFTWCAIMLAIQQLRDQEAVYSSLRELRRIFIVNKANIYITSLCKASFDTA